MMNWHQQVKVVLAEAVLTEVAVRGVLGPTRLSASMSLIFLVFRRESTLKSLNLSRKFLQLTLRQADLHLGDTLLTDKETKNESLHSLTQTTQLFCSLSIFRQAQGKKNHWGKLWREIKAKQYPVVIEAMLSLGWLRTWYQKFVGNSVQLIHLTG